MPPLSGGSASCASCTLSSASTPRSSLMWFAIDMADGTENIWFFWPMLGTGVVVAIISIVLVGVGGLFGIDWERRKVDRYLHAHSTPTVE